MLLRADENLIFLREASGSLVWLKESIWNRNVMCMDHVFACMCIIHNHADLKKDVIRYCFSCHRDVFICVCIFSYFYGFYGISI